MMKYSVGGEKLEEMRALLDRVLTEAEDIAGLLRREPDVRSKTLADKLETRTKRITNYVWPEPE